MKGTKDMCDKNNIIMESTLEVNSKLFFLDCFYICKRIQDPNHPKRTIYKGYFKRDKGTEVCIEINEERKTFKLLPDGDTRIYVDVV